MRAIATINTNKVFSEWSDFKSGIPLGLASAPRNFDAEASSNAVTLTWLPPADVGGSPIRKYEIQYGPYGGALSPAIDLSPFTNRYDISLPGGNGTKYVFPSASCY